MATTLTMEELRRMNTADLQREIRTHRQLCANMRLGIEIRKEKDTAKYRRERRTLARLLTVLEEKSQKNAEHASPITP